MTVLHEPLLIAEWPRNSREMMRIRLDSYNGNATVDVRAWYPGSDGEWKPGKSGLTIGIRHLPALASTLAMALDEAIKQGLT